MRSKRRAITAAQSDAFRNAISSCEGKLKKLKTLYKNGVHWQKCQSLVQEIHGELETAINPAAKQPDESVIHVKTTKARAKSRTINKPSTRTSPRRREALVAPIPEQVYMAYCHMSKSWFAVRVLHIEGIESCGLHESLPDCFNCDDEGHFDWKQGYEDGGPLISCRQFPVMFFGGASTFERERYGWVAAKDLQSFDPQGYQASLVPHYNAVLTFIAERNCPSPGNITCELQKVAEVETTGPHSITIETLAATSFSSAGAQDIRTHQGFNPNVPGRISCEKRKIASAAMELLTKPTSASLIQPMSASSENSPTFYNLPPLNPAPAGNTKSLPTIRSLIEKVSADRHSSNYTAATYREVVPRVEWPSLSRPIYKRQVTRSPRILPAPFNRDSQRYNPMLSENIKILRAHLNKFI
ncbi:hypothetical protein FVEG_06999 [Fusarium verticillioides 7600]|uniref:Uncharacterized protein n=1 Tax=Gibberella moniliformis (strain M3125 / FGSC 7600) TaxID=334819 RepID=W7MPK5_GIBM7|nr:hypothetical protein FVEG_06999 [Fusarium verticillioides 7600]EWG46562.1 hypothetical protein FVEG_06999 [Fusarium verticillioides 7600]